MSKIFTRAISLFIILFIFSAAQGQSEKHHRVNILLEGRELSELTRLGLALPAVNFKAGISIQGELSESELKQIADAGFQYEIIIEDMTRYYQQRNAGIDIDEVNRMMKQSSRNSTPYATPENFMLGSMGGFHTYAELLDDLNAMRALFPGLISEKEAISTNSTIEGRPVYWVRISNNPEVTQDKPRVLYTALTHAREPASMQQMLFQMWYLLENYDSDPEIQYLIDNVEMYFVPAVNPDGYIFCETTHPNGGSMHRKNKRINSDGSIGVDLNRNFGYMWGHNNSGSSPNPSAQTYRGTGPFSEPETTMQKEFAEEYNFLLALNNHTYSDLLIYPWGYNDQLTPDGDIFIEYAKFMTRENNYVYGTCYETLNYYANGVSDDWFYGEQTTKDKTFAFTPEAGKPSDGFWPQVHRIEEICAGHTHMNLGLAHLALSYAEVTELSGQYIAERNAEIPFKIINLGQQSPASYTVSLTPLSSTIIAAGEPVSFENMEVLESHTSTVSIELHPNIATGAEVKFVLSVDNGLFTWNDTITKFYGQPDVVFFDPCDNLDNWTTTSWGISTQHAYSAPASIADSPGQNYPNNANTHITITQPFDLSDTNLAWVEFYTRYDIETNWDYVQFMYSTDNQQNWTPLAGNHTAIGGSNQDTGQPLYHGTQSGWVKEEVDLTHLAGEEEVWLRFRLISDGYINKEGFYFDDFTLFTLEYVPTFSFYLPETISFFQHREKVLDFTQLVSWELEGEVTLTWEGTDNLSIELLNETNLSIINTDPFWTGTEVIVFGIEDDLATLQQSVVIQVLSVPAPVITQQIDVDVFINEQLAFLPEFLLVEDHHFSYPEDFTIALHDGNNYTIEGDFTIVPETDFTGELVIPVMINNGFADSEVFDFTIQVHPETSIDEIADDILIFYSNTANKITIDAGKKHANSRYELFVSDISGRILHQQSFTGNATLHTGLLRQGIYIINLSGDIHTSRKIVVY
ncbi:MAG: T9SS C-terminal target domain-containing protein [Bacteroidetes bacterium]|nr:MAG: T9SS C-terminal target domain-containing protein [Bacteroidota bacterium]